jgi:UDP-N-acetylmuramoyl-tripeptide--D-alanyl-D-alanine ligase
VKLGAHAVEQDLAAAGEVRVRGVSTGLEFAGVATDSRSDVRDQLFVALRGERADGHDYVAAAAAGGARGVLVALSTWERWVALPAACYAVADPLHGLQQLARASLHRHPAAVVAITGSNGKTTTKDLCVAALRGLGSVHGTRGNHNNHIGVPLTVLERTGAEKFLVAEVGANDFGEIDLLSRLLQPRVAVITNIGRAHLERFGSLGGVRRAKSEIFAGLRPGGTALLNADDPSTPELAARAGGARTRRFGFAPDADYPVVVMRDDGPDGQTLAVRGTRFRLQRSGRGNALDAAAAFAVACELGGEPAAVAAGLESCTFTAQRSTWLRRGDVVVLDDSYNANPDSMLQALAQLASHAGRRIAVLGDMLELGAEAAALHAELGERVAAAGVHLLFGLGPHMRHAVAAAARSGLGDRARHYEEIGALVEALRAGLRPGDAVLVKGSRGSRMERVVESLGAEVA